MTNSSTAPLIGRTPRSGTTVHGWRAVLFATPFMLAGLAIMLVGSGVIELGAKDAHVPLWFIFGIGSTFFIAGFSLAWHGVRGLAHRRRQARMLSERPNEPWLADHPWNSEGSIDEEGRSWIRTFFSAAFLGLFLSPFHFWAFSAEGRVVVLAFVGFFDLILLIVFGTGLYQLARWLKYGGSRVVFERFPYFQGEPLDVRFRSSGAIGPFRKLSIKLRCIQEVQEVREDRTSGDQEGPTIVCYERWADEIIVKQEGTHQAGEEVPIHFDLPIEPPATRLLGPVPSYWELEIHADTPGIDYKSTFLVPVYRMKG